MAEALGVNHWQARDWLSGYRGMPYDKVMELLGLFNSVFCSGQRVIQDYADKSLVARRDALARAKAGQIEARGKASDSLSIVDL